MESSDVARLLRKQYLESLATEVNSHLSSDPILAKLEAIGDKLNPNSTALTDHKCIPTLYDLNDALTDWRILKEQNKSIKRIFSCHDHVAHINERSSMSEKLDEIEKQVVQQVSSSKPRDRHTSYKHYPITCIEDVVSVKLEKQMVDWLLTTSSDNFKAVGICGMASSGKTALVENVLKQEPVGHQFKCIIWACLSQLTSEEEVDDCVIKYLLYRLGLDTDSPVGNVHENRDWLMEELERRLLMNSRNYILVLDDMWYCGKWFAGQFLGKLKVKGGGAVIVTSRRKQWLKKSAKRISSFI